MINLIGRILVDNRNGKSFRLLLKRFFYDASTRYDTIFAPSTALDPTKGSPLGVVRISGNKCRQVVSSVTNVSELKPRQAKLTKFLSNPKQDLIDIGLLLWFPKPNSYTGEDVCEFHLHGSQAIMRKMLETLGSIDGLRPAEPGEFTRRAVMNKKMSLIQAESLPDLMASKTDNQLKLALNGLDGTTRERYECWINNLINILAHLEASIDFGEDELIGEQKVVNDCVQRIKSLSTEISNYISMSSQCKDRVQLGFRVVILGKPNAGKSTLMNLLCRREKSIVSDIVGTTRDIVEHSFELHGHSILLNDTAGLRDNFFNVTRQDEIEMEGVKRALEAAKEADLIIYLIDASNLKDVNSIAEELSSVLKIDKSGSQSIHLVINKIDLSENTKNKEIIHKLEQIARKTLDRHDITISCISCKTQENFDGLIDELGSRLDSLTFVNHEETSENNRQSIKMDYVNERHLSLLRSASRHLTEASHLDIHTIDEMAQHVRESVDYLSRIVGTVSNEQVFDIIFRDFCIGK